MANTLKKFPMIEAYRFLRDHGLEKDAEAINFGKLQDWKYGTSVRRGHIVETIQTHSMTDAFCKAIYPTMQPADAAANLSRFAAILEGYRAFIRHKTSVPAAGNILEKQQEDESVKFAIEAHLRDFLAKNLGLLEPGLKLYQEAGRSGIEYPVTDGRIDILAIDQDDKPVVVELKLSHGRNRVLGQIAYYMAWIDQNLGRGTCRGIIVANEITHDLVLAAKRVSGVALAKYRLDFKVEVVSTST